ncbi:MAG TPA: VOC family protein [Fimbriimonadaceae bacterium]|nr:VOC family protein [Fimbriimonadaceae bacterium]HRJ32387.1 VOC family protein [Fimbriimonadaceae bacterium]
MSESVGKVVWTDLTVPNAHEVREFYQAVVGYQFLPEPMGDYEDYHLIPPGAPLEVGNSVLGICHAQGMNAQMPPAWLIYLSVADLAEALARVVQHGGQILYGPRMMGAEGFACIRDPAGAVCALYGPYTPPV